MLEINWFLLETLSIWSSVFFIILFIVVTYMRKKNVWYLGGQGSKYLEYKIGKIETPGAAWFELYMGFAVMVLMVPVIIGLYYANHIWKLSCSVEAMRSTILGLTGIVVALSIAVSIFDKRYYITFSTQDVLKKYKFGICLAVCMSSCILVSAMSSVLVGKDSNSGFVEICFAIFELLSICNLLCDTYVSLFVIGIMFSDRKFELRILNKLYQAFWEDKINTLSFKEKNSWNEGAVELNVRYLLGRYRDICDCKKISKIDKIEHVTKLEEYVKRGDREARKAYIIWNVIVWVISIGVLIVRVINIGVSHPQGRSKLIFICTCLKIFGIDTLLTAIVIGVSFIGAKDDAEKKTKDKAKKDRKKKIKDVGNRVMKAIGENIRIMILKLFSDTWGYYVKIDGHEKEIYVPAVSFRRTGIYGKFIMRMNSLIAFFNIWMNYVDIDEYNKQIAREMCKQLIEGMKVLKTQNSVMYMPIFVIGFFMYEKDIEETELKKLYAEIIEDEEKANKIELMIYNQIDYLRRNKWEGMKSPEEYMLWLQQ